MKDFSTRKCEPWLSKFFRHGQIIQRWQDHTSVSELLGQVERPTTLLATSVFHVQTYREPRGHTVLLRGDLYKSRTREEGMWKLVCMWSTDLLWFYKTKQKDRPQNKWWNKHISVFLFVWSTQLDLILTPNKFRMLFIYVYYESIKREVKKRLIFDNWCDTRLKVKVEGCTRLVYTMWQP